MSVACVDNLLPVCLERREIYRQGKANRTCNLRNITTIDLMFVGISESCEGLQVQWLSFSLNEVNFAKS